MVTRGGVATTTTTTAPNGMCTRFPLRGYERMFVMADGGSLKIVHIMIIQGANASGTAALLTHLPQAVVSTFNRHPRMRAVQVRDEFATAEVQPKITLATLSEKKLLEIREGNDDDGSETAEGDSWEMFAQVQSNIPFDRYAELPWLVRAWHYPVQNRVRLMVLSDHFMSDGISGLAVLNDIVSFASSLSQQEETPTVQLALPLRPSLYEMWLEPHKWTLLFRRWAIKLFGKAVFKSELKSFAPVIKPRSDQADFAIPLKINSSSALFDQGTAENMQNALRRCKGEGVTFFGALAATTVLAYYLGSERDKKTSTSATNKPFSLALDVDLNMRKRVPFPVIEDQVGAYMGTGALEFVRKEGVDFETTTFWDLARKCKSELDDLLESFLAPLTMIFLDEFVHSETQPKFAQEVPVPYSISSDVDISNIGRYPYKTTHTFRAVSPATAAAAGEESPPCNEELVIDSVHVYNSIPHLGSSAILYVTSTDKFNYSMMHKYQTKDAQRVFAAFTTCIEHIGEIGSKETMAQVAAFVAHAVGAAGSKETGGSRRIGNLCRRSSPEPSVVCSNKPV